MLSARILLVEHDPDLRVFFTQYLTMQGYTVTAVPSGESALAHDAAVDLLITGWHLLEMSGIELIRMMQRRSPHLKTILTCMYTHVHEAARAAGADGWYCKSTEISQLCVEIARVLAGQPDSRHPRPAADSMPLVG